MKIIYDTNIIIDALRGNAFDALFETEQEIFISSENIPELNDDAQKLAPKISKKEIIVLNTDEKTMERCTILLRKYPSGPSFPDLMTLAHVFTSNLDTLAAADKQLRRAALGENIEPLWLGDLLKFLFVAGKMSQVEALQICELAYQRGMPKFARKRWPLSEKNKGDAVT